VPVQNFVGEHEKAGWRMLMAVMMQAIMLFPDIVIGDDMDMSANEATAEFNYLMRERIGVNFLGNYG
jgi:hypothetical protein